MTKRTKKILAISSIVIIVLIIFFLLFRFVFFPKRDRGPAGDGTTSSSQIDTDGDGIPDNEDTDDDNDGILDVDDDDPLFAAQGQGQGQGGGSGSTTNGTSTQANPNITYDINGNPIILTGDPLVSDPVDLDGNPLATTPVILTGTPIAGGGSGSPTTQITNLDPQFTTLAEQTQFCNSIPPFQPIPAYCQTTQVASSDDQIVALNEQFTTVAQQTAFCNAIPSGRPIPDYCTSVQSTSSDQQVTFSDQQITQFDQQTQGQGGNQQQIIDEFYQNLYGDRIPDPQIRTRFNDQGELIITGRFPRIYDAFGNATNQFRAIRLVFGVNPQNVELGLSVYSMYLYPNLYQLDAEGHFEVFVPPSVIQPEPGVTYWFRAFQPWTLDPINAMGRFTVPAAAVSVYHSEITQTSGRFGGFVPSPIQNQGINIFLDVDRNRLESPQLAGQARSVVQVLPAGAAFAPAQNGVFNQNGQFTVSFGPPSVPLQPGTTYFYRAATNTGRVLTTIRSFRTQSVAATVSHSNLKNDRVTFTGSIDAPNSTLRLWIATQNNTTVFDSATTFIPISSLTPNYEIALGPFPGGLSPEGSFSTVFDGASATAGTVSYVSGQPPLEPGVTYYYALIAGQGPDAAVVTPVSNFTMPGGVVAADDQGLFEDTITVWYYNLYAGSADRSRYYRSEQECLAAAQRDPLQTAATGPVQCFSLVTVVQDRTRVEVSFPSTLLDFVTRDEATIFGDISTRGQEISVGVLHGPTPNTMTEYIDLGVYNSPVGSQTALTPFELNNPNAPNTGDYFFQIIDNDVPYEYTGIKGITFGDSAFYASVNVSLNQGQQKITETTFTVPGTIDTKNNSIGLKFAYGTDPENLNQSVDIIPSAPTDPTVSTGVSATLPAGDDYLDTDLGRWIYLKCTDGCPTVDDLADGTNLTQPVTLTFNDGTTYQTVSNYDSAYLPGNNLDNLLTGVWPVDGQQIWLDRVAANAPLTYAGIDDLRLIAQSITGVSFAPPSTQYFQGGNRFQNLPGASSSFVIEVPNLTTNTQYYGKVIDIDTGAQYTTALPFKPGKQAAGNVIDTGQIVSSGLDGLGITTTDIGPLGPTQCLNRAGAVATDSSGAPVEYTGLVRCGRGKPILDGGVDNPAFCPCTFNEVVRHLQRFISFLITLIVPIAAALFMYAGFLFLTSGGNESKRSAAKSIFKNVVYGILIIMFAWLIVASLLTLLGVDQAYILLNIGQ